MARYRKKKQRLDLRNGGRVAFNAGQAARRRQEEEAANERGEDPRPEETPTPTPAPAPEPKPTTPPEGVTPMPAGTTITPTPTPTPAPAPAPKPTTAPTTAIDVKAPTTAPATQQYGAQTDDSITEGVVTDAEGTPLEGNPPIWYWDTVSGSWRPTDAMIAQEKTYGRIWDNQTGSFVDPDVGFSQYLTDEQELERQQRLERSASDLEAAKRGELPIPQITAPQMIEEGPASEVVQMAQPTKVGDVTIFGEGEDIPQESITTGTVSTAKAPDSVSKYIHSRTN